MRLRPAAVAAVLALYAGAASANPMPADFEPFRAGLAAQWVSPAQTQAVLGQVAQRFGERSAEMVEALTLAMIAAYLAQAPEASEAYARQALALAKVAHGPAHPTTATAMHSLSDALAYRPENEIERRALLTEALGARIPTLGETHIETLATIKALAQLDLPEDAAQQAPALLPRIIADLRRFLVVAERTASCGPMEITRSWAALARAHARRGDVADARAALAKAEAADPLPAMMQELGLPPTPSPVVIQARGEVAARARR